MNNNMMEINTQNNKDDDKKFSIANIKKKIEKWKQQRKEDKEDKQKAKEELARVKEEEKNAKNVVTSAEVTITNETISKKSLKNTKPSLTPQEERRKKRERKKLIKNIMTIPEIILVVLLALFLKNKYIAYSKNVHQILTYGSSNFVYEIHRDNDNIKVLKSYRKDCPVAPCELTNLSEYEIKYDKNKMRALRIFMDIEFKFKSESKSINIDDLKTDFGKKSIYSMIHNNPAFLDFKTYNKYTIMDYEQMSSYTTKGYKYTTDGDKKILSIALGERPTSGYSLIVNSAYQDGDNVYFYVKEQVPSKEDSTMALVTHPLIRIELEESPKTIYVYNVDSGEEYPNYDVPPTTQPSIITNRKETTKDFISGLRDALLKG